MRPRLLDETCDSTIPSVAPPLANISQPDQAGADPANVSYGSKAEVELSVGTASCRHGLALAQGLEAAASHHPRHLPSLPNPAIRPCLPSPGGRGLEPLGAKRSARRKGEGLWSEVGASRVTVPGLSVHADCQRSTLTLSRKDDGDARALNPSPGGRGDQTLRPNSTHAPANLRLQGL